MRQARERAGLSQSELSARTGVAQPNIAAYETGRRSPSSDMLGRIFAALRLPPSVLVARRRDAVLEIAASNKASDVRVFGSVLRGEDTPDSDVDLLVRFAPGASLLDQAQLVLELEDLLGVPVDVVSDRGSGERLERIRSLARPL
ncbi:helix-turn-helix domain-containing protein [Nakamurella silvestris]|nr:helix-turn-helix domain-containing protein [Nakamurella silvestris]